MYVDESEGFHFFRTRYEKTRWKELSKHVLDPDVREIKEMRGGGKGRPAFGGKRTGNDYGRYPRYLQKATICEANSPQKVPLVEATTFHARESEKCGVARKEKKRKQFGGGGGGKKICHPLTF